MPGCVDMCIDGRGDVGHAGCAASGAAGCSAGCSAGCALGMVDPDSCHAGNDFDQEQGSARIEPKMLTSVELFHHCADNLSSEDFWEEFLRRYQQLIARSVSCAYRRFTCGDFTPVWRIAELTQEVYLRLLKDDCALLRRFHGATATAAEAYLAQIAIHTTGDVLRREMASKRQGDAVAAELPEADAEVARRVEKFSLPERLAERELLRILAREGGEWRRDALIFLLHLQLGLTVKEIVRTGLFKLRPTTVFGILVRVRSRLADALVSGSS